MPEKFSVTGDFYQTELHRSLHEAARRKPSSDSINSLGSGTAQAVR
jgi:hypothetical protein